MKNPNRFVEGLERYMKEEWDIETPVIVKWEFLPTRIKVIFKTYEDELQRVKYIEQWEYFMYLEEKISKLNL